MTNRERIVTTLLCQPTDRVPFGVGIGFYPWGETMERWRTESGISDLNPAGLFGYDAGFHGVPAEYGPWPHVESEVIEENDRFIISKDFRGIITKNRRDHHSMPDFIAHPIRNEQDWSAYKDLHLQPRLDERLKRLDEFADGRADVDAPIQLGSFPWGHFGTARDMMGAEELLYAFYDMPDLVADMMQTFTDLWIAIYERVVEKVKVDHIHLWEDMAGRQGSLISMEMVEKFMMPHYDRTVAFARKHDIPIVSVDTDGNVDQLVPIMVEHGINMMFPFEVQAGNDVEEFQKKFPGLGIIGGLDKNMLAGTLKDIHVELDRAEGMLANGGAIPGCDHLIPPNVPWENWRYFNEHLRGICGV